jgi:hypothetical protein
MHLAHYLGLLHRAQIAQASAFREVAAAHTDEPDIASLCEQQARHCDDRARQLRPLVERYAGEAPEEPDRLHSELFRGPREGGLALLRDLQDLYLMTAECDICWTVVGQAAQDIRDEELVAFVQRSATATTIELAWLRGRMKQAAPRALVVA